MTNSEIEIAVLPGDGMGTEVMAAAIEVMAEVQARVGGFRLHLTHHPAGALAYRQTEGLFFERGKTLVKGDDEACDAMVITRKGSTRMFDFALRLARRR